MDASWGAIGQIADTQQAIDVWQITKLRVLQEVWWAGTHEGR